MKNNSLKSEKVEINCGRPGAGEGVKKGQIFADVLYGWPLSKCNLTGDARLEFLRLKCVSIERAGQ